MQNELLGNYCDRDDTIHTYDDEDYFEWWYCDARFDNGYSCVMVFYWMSPYTKPNSPVTMMNIYTPEGKNLMGYAAIDKKDCSSSLDHCDARMGNSSIRQEGDKYFVSMRAHKIGADLTYYRRIPGWKQNGDGYLYNEGDKKQGWVIAAPRSEVEGTIYINGISIPVKGQGYHDKNWGNLKFHHCFSRWYWGRLYDDRFTLIYYWLLPAQSGKQLTSRLLLALDNKPILVTNKFTMDIVEEEACRKTGIKIPSRMILKDAGNSNISFRCDIAASLIEGDKAPKEATEYDLYYWRSLGSHIIEVKAGDKTIINSGKLLNEHLLINK